MKEDVHGLEKFHLVVPKGMKEKNSKEAHDGHVSRVPETFSISRS